MSSNKPLTDIRVLDLTRLLPGPMCTLHLADMGADVIKIEDTEDGDYARWMGVIKPRQSGYFLAVNRNKRAISLNLRHPQGKELFLKLASTADVIVESFRPNVVNKLGIDYETIKAINPKIVYCAITGYGQTGPYKMRAGHDLNYCSYVGVTDQIGACDGAPVVSNFQIADLAGGALSASMGILAALVAVARTGIGTYLDVAMTDCTLAHNVLSLSSLVQTGQTQPRGEDFLSGALPCYGIYPTKDGRYIALGALEQKFWENFCHAVQKPDWVSQHWVTGQAAKQLQQAVTTLFMSKTRAEWIDCLSHIDCCFSPILSLEESQHDPQLQAREMFIKQSHPTEGDVLQFAFPIKFSAYHCNIERPAPLLGEHSLEVFKTLGYTTSEIQLFEEKGILYCQTHSDERII
jgi:crotonobetainyl-CoA:carnitine CoA-transferase CaiB-like acyl-CoA transferase